MGTASGSAGVRGGVLDSISPGAGAEVMGTGIVSIALTLDGFQTLSRILLVIATVMWLTLAILLPLRARRDPERFRADVRTPPALTSVAATDVLGTRLALLGWTWAGIAELVIALVVWALLIGAVLRHWKTPTVGASLILTVSTESLAVLAATLAISTLAAGKLLDGAKALTILGGGGGVLKELALVLWVLTMLWLPGLLIAELVWPRFVYDVRRWSTVFPLGMYAACSFVVGAAASAGAITSFARVWVWIALAVWAVVLAGMMRRGIRAVSLITRGAAGAS